MAHWAQERLEMELNNNGGVLPTGGEASGGEGSQANQSPAVQGSTDMAFFGGVLLVGLVVAVAIGFVLMYSKVNNLEKQLEQKSQAPQTQQQRSR